MDLTQIIILNKIEGAEIEEVLNRKQEKINLATLCKTEEENTCTKINLDNSLYLDEKKYNSTYYTYVKDEEVFRLRTDTNYITDEGALIWSRHNNWQMYYLKENVFKYTFESVETYFKVEIPF